MLSNIRHSEQHHQSLEGIAVRTRQLRLRNITNDTTEPFYEELCIGPANAYPKIRRQLAQESQIDEGAQVCRWQVPHARSNTI